jgi:hypothetical protein
MMCGGGGDDDDDDDDDDDGGEDDEDDDVDDDVTDAVLQRWAAWQSVQGVPMHRLVWPALHLLHGALQATAKVNTFALIAKADLFVA